MLPRLPAAVRLVSVRPQLTHVASAGLAVKTRRLDAVCPFKHPVDVLVPLSRVPDTAIASFHTYCRGNLQEHSNEGRPGRKPHSQGGPSNSPKAQLDETSEPGGESDDSESKRKSEESLLRAFGMKDWTVQVVTAKNGMEAVEVGGRLAYYLDPGASGSIRDRLVDPHLVDNYGVTSINQMTEGQMADYFAEQELIPTYQLEKIGDVWVKIPVSFDSFEDDEEQDDYDENDDAGESGDQKR